MWRESKRAAFPYAEIQQLYTLEDDRAFFQEVIIQECEVWLAESEGIIQGLLALRENLIDQLFVRVGTQRQGVGAVLLERARERFPDDLKAYTFQKSKPARAFFEKNGFEIVKAGISPPPENQPDVEYTWHPSQ